MDYVQNKILHRIENLKEMSSDDKYCTIAYLYKVLLEYQLYLLFSCIWDKGRNMLSREEIQTAIIDLQAPVLGKLLDNIIMMEKKSTFKILNHCVSKYKKYAACFISIRNAYFAHGTIVPNIQNNIWKSKYLELENIFHEIIGLNIPVLSANGTFYYRNNTNSTDLTVFESNSEYCRFRHVHQEAIKNMGLDEGNLCYIVNNDIFIVSPFLQVNATNGTFDQYEFFYFTKYNIANNRFYYNKVSNFDDKPVFDTIISGYFQKFQVVNKYTISKANGVICNVYENNYDHFINITPISSYVHQIWEFLKSNRSSTCITIRGGGGIGKTALIQYICTKYIFDPFKNNTGFDYVIFCSAKNRQLKQTKNVLGTIQIIDNESVVTSYIDILIIISKVLGLKIPPDCNENISLLENAIVTQKGILLIIDDFETLSNVEKEKVINLISRLSVDMHKVVITTRSQYMIGREYYIPELTHTQVIGFLKEYFTIKNSDLYLRKFNIIIESDNNCKKIADLSQGLPLLTLQIAQILIINGFDINKIPEKWGNDVEEFLLGKLYTYFSNFTSKLLFIAISQYYKYGCTEISVDEISYIYTLYCSSFKQLNVDFNQDLIELKKLKIIYLGPSHIEVCNNISGKLLSECKQNIIKDNIFNETTTNAIDDELVYLIITKGIKDALLEYSCKKPHNISFEYVKIFSLSNPFSYTNSERFCIIESYLYNFYKKIDVDVISSLYHRCNQYFHDTESFNELFYNNICKKHNCIIPEIKHLSDFANLQKPIGEHESAIQNLINELEEIQESIDEYLLKGRDHRIPQDYLIDISARIHSLIGHTCRLTMANVLKLSIDSKWSAQLEEIQDSILEISKTITMSSKLSFDIMDYDECKILLKKISSIEQESGR